MFQALFINIRNIWISGGMKSKLCIENDYCWSHNVTFDFFFYSVSHYMMYMYVMRMYTFKLFKSIDSGIYIIYSVGQTNSLVSLFRVRNNIV